MRERARDAREAAAGKLRRSVVRAPSGLEVVDVGPAADGWVLISYDAKAPVPDLPPALLDVLMGVARGETNVEIARRRKRSVRTIDNQITALLQRFGARSRVELVRMAMVRRGSK